MAEQSECLAVQASAEDECPAVHSDDECADQDEILEQQLQQTMDPTSVKRYTTVSNPELLDKVKSWTDQIFNGLTKTPSCGRPGQVMVFGERAVPILAPKQKKVMMAGSEIGKGRVLFVTSEAFARGIGGKKSQGSTATLQSNIKAWLLKKQDSVGTNAQKLSNCENLTDLDKSNTIVFSMDFNGVLARHEEILDFVKQGGGFLLAFRPWFWYNEMKVEADKENVKISVRHFLKPLGIAIGDGKIWGGQNGFEVPYVKAQTEGEAVYQHLLGCHIAHALECCCRDELRNMSDYTRMIEDLLTTPPMYARRALDDKIQAVFQRCHDYIKDCVPTPQKKLKDADKLGAVALCNKMSLLGYGFQQAPGVDKFPGQTESPGSCQECVDIEITSNVQKIHATGYYLPAGVELKVVVVKKQGEDKNWLVRIGAHSDRLYKKTHLLRWPEVVLTRPLKGKEFTIQSPFGGLVYLKSPAQEATIKLQMFNVVEAPYFNLEDTQNVANWELRRKAPGPWADVQGKYIRFTLPSSSIRSVDDPSKVMAMWDKVMELYHDLRGSDVTKHRGQWVVADVQISAGAMHSGYPIMGHLKLSSEDSGVMNYEKLITSGFWGVFHELGHNMQRGMWTFNGTREITCNIFALYAVEEVSGIPVSQNPKTSGEDRIQRYAKYLEKDISFADLPKKPMTGLGFYAHLVTTFGWESYKAVFRQYEELQTSETPKNSQEKIDQWLTRFSRQVRVSIAPIMSLWKMGASEEAVVHLQDLTPFLPDDEITVKVAERVKDIEKAFPGLVREI